jgi:hypothetical protein
MTRMRPARGILLSCVLVSCLHSVAVHAEAPTATPASPPVNEPRDGQHDFDFNLGTWKTHIRRLLHPLSGSDEWVELDGTVAVRKVWGGHAQLEEIEADGSTGHFEGLTLFLYNPEAHQWAQYFANSAAGGKTWESNFIATLTRENETQQKSESVSPQPSGLPKPSHDFDFNFVVWKTHITRRQHPLTGSNTWVDYDGTSDVNKIWNGRASLFELEATGPAGHIEGVGLRLYNPKSRQWSLNWASSRDGVIGKPMIGEFANGEGHFYDQEDFQGRSILDRNGFSDIKPDSSRFEQAFSDDGGKNWETNWIMTFTR